MGWTREGNVVTTNKDNQNRKGAVQVSGRRSKRRRRQIEVRERVMGLLGRKKKKERQREGIGGGKKHQGLSCMGDVGNGGQKFGERKFGRKEAKARLTNQRILGGISGGRE